MKVIQNEINIYREPTVKGRKLGQINDLERKEENIQLKQKEENEKKMSGLGTSRTTLNVPYLNHRGTRRRRGRATN